MAAGLFGVLCWLVKNSARFSKFEERLQRRLLRPQSNWWWQLIAFLFDPKLMVLWDFILAAVLLLTGRWSRAVYVLATLGTVDAFGIFVKHHVKRQRPGEFMKDTTTYSFPSGHTLGTTMMALMITMLFASPWLHVLILVAWILVIACRLTLRAHYPADVLGAVLLADAWWIAAEYGYILLMR